MGLAGGIVGVVIGIVLIIAGIWMFAIGVSDAFATVTVWAIVYIIAGIILAIAGFYAAIFLGIIGGFYND